MIISPPADDRDGCRSLVCDASGIIIAEMAYRCIVCAHISDSIADGQDHYQSSHMNHISDMGECRNGQPVSARRCSGRQRRDTGCHSPPDFDDDVNFSDREDDFEFDQSSPATSRNRKQNQILQSDTAASNTTSQQTVQKGGYVTCTVCNMTKYYQSVQRRYGQFTCMGCAKFFGRFLLKPKKYSCPELGSCPLDAAPRCKACLLLACMQTYVIDEKRMAIVEANRPVRGTPVSGPAASHQSVRMPQSRKMVGTGVKSCKRCAGCLADDCGSCMFCLDKTKFGGSNTLKKKCITRRCLMSDHPLQPLLIQPTA